MQQLKSATISLRISPELKAKLEKLAAADRRSVSTFIELLIERALKDADQPAKRSQKLT
jgi:hypothetical protein